MFEERYSLCSKKDIPCVRRKTFLVFEERHSLCSKTMKRPIFGRTDLRKGVSEAKFDVEADFDVEKSKIGPKSAENHKKP